MKSDDEREVVWDPADDEPPIELPPKRHPLANVVLTICGLIAMASPLALWISWTQEILMSVFSIAIACILVCVAIVHFDPE